MWIKNTGTTDIFTVNHSDVFFGPDNDFYRAVHGAGSPPSWEFEIEGGGVVWEPTSTVKITIHPTAAVTTGTYLVKVVIPNGLSARTIYSVE